MDVFIPLHDLEKTTEGFSDKHMIGRGGYGKVYKGLYNGEEIAVKLFYDVQALDNKQFENEFFNLLKIEHPNVVRLVGYCYESHNKPVKYNGTLQFCQHIYRILCFEFLQGGSLDKYLKESHDHDWPTSYNIIKGTCEGLNFLHGGCGSQILHLDLKPANILLDENMQAKVADFGLSRFFDETHTHITNTIIGTRDYMPPEFVSNNQISPKNDVYSLGVIIIEILAGRRGYSEFREMDDSTKFIEKVIMNWRDWINATTSPCPSAALHQVETCIKIAIKCVNTDKRNRPTVAEILDILHVTEDAGFIVGQSLPTPTKSGQRGGSGGGARDTKEKPWRLASLKICYGGLINAFTFSYIDQSGKRQHEGPWGKVSSNRKTETICFGPSEFVEEVFGAFGSRLKSTLVLSLTFVTNVRAYGPFGNPYLKDWEVTHFRFMADEGSSIVGFHGRSGTLFDSIGVYMYPNNKTTIRGLSMPMILEGQSLPIPTKSEQRGGSGGGSQDIKEKPWRLANLTICYGGLINAFSFSYIDQSGKRQHEGPWGQERSNSKTETICFGPSEFVEEVSGAFGSNLKFTLVISLMFVTNVRTYGPFGNPYLKDWAVTHFRFMADEGSSIVGFHGRSGTLLDSIGVYMYPNNKTTTRDLSRPVILKGQSFPTLAKSGQRGGNGGGSQDIKEKPWRLANLTICYGGLINAFSFSYIDQSGKRQHEGPWGQERSNCKTETICFGPSELVEEVSGAFGSNSKFTLVISLTFVTNVRTYGPFGNPYHKDWAVSHFRFMADECSSIVGFHGRSGTRLDSIGVYMYRNNKTTFRDLSVPVILEGQSLPTATKSGPWGGSAGIAHDISEKPRRLTSLTVSYKGLIDAFSFSYIDQAGKKQSVGPWGDGYHYDKTETIHFDPSEFILELSGAYGSHHGNIIVKFITIVTNITTYGPFGTPDHPGPDVSATHFRFTADEGSSIVGFYGRSSKYINAIGVYTL